MRSLVLLIGVSLLMCLNSCLYSKKVVYFKDVQYDSIYKATPIPPLKIQKYDRISVQVSARNPELAIPFNNQAGAFTVSESGAVIVQLWSEDIWWISLEILIFRCWELCMWKA